VARRRVEDLGRHIVRRTHCQAQSTLVSCSTPPSCWGLRASPSDDAANPTPPFVTDESFSHHPAARFRTLSHVASAPNPARAQRGGRPTHARSRNVLVALPKPKGERQTPSYTTSQLKRGSPRHAHSHLPRRRAVGLAMGTPSRVQTTVFAMLFSEACVRPGAQHITCSPTSSRYDAHASSARASDGPPPLAAAPSGAKVAHPRAMLPAADNPYPKRIYKPSTPLTRVPLAPGQHMCGWELRGDASRRR